MARPLVFQFGERELPFTLQKVDRSKLYGYREQEVLDEEGAVCELATLADDGRTVVGRGGTGIGYLSADGEWCDKSKLQPVDPEGKPIHPVPSSFGAPIALNKTATVDEYLTHNVRLVYRLVSDESVDELVAELRKGTIYSFPYSYRGGLVADAGFLLLGDDGNVFLAVGNPTSVEMIGLQQTAVAVSEEEADEEETDLMDFDMI